MQDRDQIIARAALGLYVARGVRRTTMQDIAEAAGLTRQTVYNAFGNTDGVLKAAIHLYVDELWQQVLTDWQSCETLELKLDVLLNRFAVDSWDFLNSSPQAAELERGYNAAGRAAIAEAREGFHPDIAALFTPWAQRLEVFGTTPMGLAEHISFAVEGVKYNCDTRADLLRGLATLKAGVLALTAQIPA